MRMSGDCVFWVEQNYLTWEFYTFIARCNVYASSQLIETIIITVIVDEANNAIKID